MHIDLGQLKYYPENPRIYSLVYTGETEPSQKDIEEKLQRMDHVKDHSFLRKAPTRDETGWRQTL